MNARERVILSKPCTHVAVACGGGGSGGGGGGGRCGVLSGRVCAHCRIKRGGGGRSCRVFLLPLSAGAPPPHPLFLSIQARHEKEHGRRQLGAAATAAVASGTKTPTTPTTNTRMTSDYVCNLLDRFDRHGAFVYGRTHTRRGEVGKRIPQGSRSPLPLPLSHALFDRPRTDLVRVWLCVWRSQPPPRSNTKGEGQHVD